MNTDFSQSKKLKRIKKIDDDYSKRFIALDPSGYFLIKVNQALNELIVEHFNNEVDSEGRALNPETGEIISCKNQNSLSPSHIFKGKTAKEIGIKITEENCSGIISKLDHALYLGRELQKAEGCLLNCYLGPCLSKNNPKLAKPRTT